MGLPVADALRGSRDIMTPSASTSVMIVPDRYCGRYVPMTVSYGGYATSHYIPSYSYSSWLCIVDPTEPMTDDEIKLIDPDGYGKFSDQNNSRALIFLESYGPFGSQNKAVAFWKSPTSWIGWGPTADGAFSHAMRRQS